jgi:iron-sulfur cluster assembly protein
MASSFAARSSCPAASSTSRAATRTPLTTSLRPRPTLLALRAGGRLARAASAAADAPVITEQPISLTPAAVRHLERLRREENRESVLLRMGVRAGGCSGMSYDMKFEDEGNIDKEDDTVLEFPNLAPDAPPGSPPLRVAVDGKSLLFLFGMQVDYSDALVGGGFKFINPQATDTCGCGKSFAA